MPQTVFVKLASGELVGVTVQQVNVADKATTGPNGATTTSRDHIPGRRMLPPPTTRRRNIFLRPAARRCDIVTGAISYADINPGDVPTVKTNFDSFTYQNALHTDVTTTLTAAQLAAIHAVEVPLVVVQDPAGINHGVATWTYKIADGAFDFLAAGEMLTLTYMAHVDNNFAASNESKEVPFTITITGTNDVPVITTSVPQIDFAGGKTTPRRRSDRARSDQRDADVQGPGSHGSPHGCCGVDHRGARRR